MGRRIRVWSIAWLAVAMVLAWLLPSPSFAQTDAKCRRKIGQGVRLLSLSIARQKNRCHKLRMNGDLPPAINCNDPNDPGNTWADNGFQRGSNSIARAQTKLQRKTDFGCNAAFSQPLDVGYSTCPSPCESVPLGTFAGVASCQDCLVQGFMDDVTANTYGTPPVGADPELITVCQNEVGRAVRRYLAKRMRLQQSCQFRKDRGIGNFFSVECDEIDVVGNKLQPRIELFEAQLGVVIQEECQFVDFATELDTCGTDVPSVISCLRSTVRACADAMFASVYPGS